MTTLDVSTLSMPVAALIASIIGASATITAAMIQLRIAWRKELKARESRAPITRKNRRGPVTAVIVLAVASAVGGFALSQYFVTKGNAATQAMENELRVRLELLSDVARRLERASLAQGGAAGASSERSASATVSLPSCTVKTDAARACSRDDAVAVVVCAELPAGTVPAGVQRFVRERGDTRPWSEAQMAPGQHPVDGEFVGAPAPGAEANTVCQEYRHWSSEERVVRLRVGIGDAVTPGPTPSPVPTAQH
jgi:hypothetical protein